MKIIRQLICFEFACMPTKIIHILSAYNTGLSGELAVLLVISGAIRTINEMDKLNTNEWVKEWVTVNECIKLMNELMNERTNERTKEHMIERTNKWMNE